MKRRQKLHRLSGVSTLRSQKFLLILSFLFTLAACITHQTASAADFTHNFKAGWNLISLPCSPINSLPSVVFAPPFDNVAMLHSTGYIYKPAMTSAGYGIGYWAYFASDTTVAVTGTAVNLPQIEIDIRAGWNLIGSPFTTSLWASATIGGTPVNTSTNYLYEYDPATGRYATSSIYLSQWKGYYIKSNIAGKLVLKNNGYIPPDPNMPTNVQANPCVYGTKTLLCVTWTAPANPDMNKYKVFVYHPTEEFEEPYSGNKLIPKTMYTIGGLSPGQSYGIEVSSVQTVNDQILKESDHTMRAAKSTVANAGNQAVVSFRAVTASSRSGGRALGKTGGGLQSGFEVVPDAQVELRNSAGTLVGNGTTDEYGWAEFSSGLATDTYSIDAVKEDEVPGQSAGDIGVHTTVTLGPGALRHLHDIELKETGYIWGNVILADVPAPSDQYLFAHVVIPGTMYDAWCDENGNFLLHWVPPTSGTDTYRIVALRDEYGPVEQTGLTVEPFSIKPEGTHAASMTIYSDKGSISGTVRDEDGLPLADVAVNPEYSGLYGQTGATGSFMITYVPAATYTVIFSKTGYETRTATGVVVTAPFKTAVATMTLPIKYSRLDISPLGTAIPPGGEQQFTVNGTPILNLPVKDLTNNITWSSSNPAIGAISSTGHFTASPTATGSTTITATYATCGISVSTTLAVNAAPHITDISPNKGNNDVFTSVTVTGTGFVNGASIYIGTYPAANVSVFSSSRIVAQVPYSIPRGDYPVKVSNPDGLYHASGTFHVELPPPVISTVLPTNGKNDRAWPIQISGGTFINGAPLSVKLVKDGVVTPLTSVSLSGNNLLFATVSVGLPFGFYDVIVSNGDGKSATKTAAFEVTIDVVALTGRDPVKGMNATGTIVTITGNPFYPGAKAYIEKGLNSYELNNVNVVSTTEMKALVPAGLPWGNYNFKVINADHQSGSLPNAFNVTLPAPEIITYTPEFMINSEERYITLTGKNFVPGSVVRIGGTNASVVTVATSTELVFLAPTGIAAGYYPLTVTNPDSEALSAATSGFIVKAISRIDVIPASASVQRGRTIQFSASCILTYEAGSEPEDCTNDVFWTSSIPGLGSISTTGLFTASPDNYGSLIVRAFRGGVTSGDVPVTIYEQSTLFSNYGQDLLGSRSYTFSLFANDLDNDGDMDVIQGNYGRPTYIWLNDGSGNFTATSNLGTSNTNSVYSVDLNNDGFADIIQGKNGQPLTVWSNNGHGAFTSTWTAPAVFATCTVAAADVDRDGDMDIIQGNFNNVTRIYLNDGSGQFPAYNDVGNGAINYTQSVFAADVDNDGYVDIIQANCDGFDDNRGEYTAPNRCIDNWPNKLYPIKVWHNNGAGAFPNTIWQSENVSTRSIFAADFNGDGFVDIAMGGHAGSGQGISSRIYLNDGDGTFSRAQDFGSVPWEEGDFAADVDNDGDIDILEGGHNGSDGTKVFLNNGNGYFLESGTLLNMEGGRLFAADVNGDGIMDIIPRSGRILLGWGLQANNRPAAPWDFSAEASAMDPDGKMDDITFTWSDGHDAESSARELTYNIKVGTAANADNIVSGVTGIGYGNAGSNNSMILRNLPYGLYFWNIQTIDAGLMKSQWAVPKSFISGPGFVYTTQDFMEEGESISQAFPSDMDNDGHTDIVEGGYGSPTRVWKNDGTGKFTLYWRSPENNHSNVYAADFDNDGYLDILEINVPGEGGSPTKIWRNNHNGTFSTYWTCTGCNLVPGGGTATDMNNDGRVDILIQAGWDSTGNNQVWKNEGGGVFTKLWEHSANKNRALIGRDMDNDGYKDIVESVYGANLSIWWNNQNISFATATTVTAGPQGTILADMNNDGFTDIFTTHTGNSRLLRNNGNRTFINQWSGASYSSYGAIGADMDNDGRTDAIIGVDCCSDFIWLHNGNDGSPAFSNSLWVDNPASGFPYPADFNEDGMLDLALGTTPMKIAFLKQIRNVNTVPGAPALVAPAHLGHSASTVNFTWSNGTDVQTNVNALTYNLRVGTTPGGNNVMSGAVAVGPGNVGHTLSWILNGLPNGTYYWAVQTVDAGFMRSSWSSEWSFTIP